MTRSLFARLPNALASAAIAAGALCAALPAGADEALPVERPTDWGLWTLPPASPIMRGIEGLNNAITIIIALITVLVFALMGYIVWKFNAKAHPKPSVRTHNTPLEVIWTLIPVVILLGIAFPSFRLLYAEGRAPDAKLTLKVTGHQWYWSYAFPDYGISFDSNVIQDADLKPGDLRLLSVDAPLVLPAGVDIRIQVSADDVIHSWSVVPLGVKVDAVPGRLNETWTNIDKPGIYFGQCSQLCGVNHGYMPIEVRAVPMAEFQAWLDAHKPTKKSSLEGGAALADAASQR